jgi:hypothetical protein
MKNTLIMLLAVNAVLSVRRPVFFVLLPPLPKPTPTSVR